MKKSRYCRDGSVSERKEGRYLLQVLGIALR